jgi:hypothetical protein
MEFFDSADSDQFNPHLNSDWTNADSHLTSFELTQAHSADSKWQAYQRLEMLPPQVTRSVPTFTFGLGYLWRTLLQLLVAELIEEQQVDYLERCLASEDKQRSRSALQRFLTLIK